MADAMEIQAEAASPQPPDWSTQVDRQLPYQPRSQGVPLDTLSPASAIAGLRQVFDRIEAVTGRSVDDYVRDRLQEPSLESLFEHYAAEQIDSLALAIYNYEYQQKASLIAHDTGLGKTRIMVGLCRYAILQNLIPAIVTADPVLYNDILARDALDTGNRFNPFFTNNDLKLELKTPQGDILGEIRTPADHYQTVRQYTEQGSIAAHDCILTTYGQLTGSASQDRRALLETLAPRLFLIADESHKAGGAAGVEQKRGRDPDDEIERNPNALPSVTEFFQDLIQKTPAFVASSATAIKDPIVASRLFYETTDLRYSASDRDSFAAHLREGGVPLQQMVFSMWAASGGFIRCQKSYAGVDFSLSRVTVDLQTAEDTSKALNAIWKFDKAKNIAVQDLDAEYKARGQAADTRSNAVGEGGAQSTIFTSVLHNLMAAYNLAYVADALADKVIHSIESGEKPVIMLFNTMETMIKDFITTYNEAAQLHNLDHPDEPIAEIKRNDPVPIKAGELAMRYLEKSRLVRLIDPYLDPHTQKQTIVTHRLTDQELGPYAVELYNRAKRAIAAIPAQIPVSPIDYIKKRVEAAGYTIGEITGRTQMLNYSSADLSRAVTTLTTRSASTKQKQKVMADFQSGRLDAVITNSTTGYSLHAARTVDDQRRRCMFIPQPNPDINQVEQALGRVFRAGSVNPAIHAPDAYDAANNPIYGKFQGAYGLPRFELIAGAGLPTSERQLAIVQRKMDVLKANTTGDRGSNFEFEGMPNFMDEFGCEVALRLMEADWILHADLDYPLGRDSADLKLDRAIQKVTGRAPMLVSDAPPTPDCPYPSLARQAWLYDTLAADYNELLAQKQALGENTLEAQRLDLRARPRQRRVLNPGNPEVQSAFTEPTYLVEVMARTGRKPYTTLQVANLVRDAVGATKIAALADHDDSQRSEIRELGRHQAEVRVNQLQTLAEAFKTTHSDAAQAQIQMQQGKVAQLSTRLEQQQALKANWQTQIRALVGQRDAEAVQTLAQLDENLSAQEPKLDRLRGQLNDAKQTLNKHTADLERLQKTIDAQFKTVSEALTAFPVGQGIQMVDIKKGNILYGVVTGVAHLPNTNNPVAPTSWKLNLAVVDGMRELSLKFDKLNTKSVTVRPVETAYSFSNLLQPLSIYALFDDRQIQAEEKRYLVAGQVMATELTGTFAQVTDDQGHIHPVYLLNRSFNPDTDLDKKLIAIETPDQAHWFLFSGSRCQGELATPDGALKVRVSLRGDGQGLELETPFATAKGKKYFGNQPFLKFTGDFHSMHRDGKEYMVAHVPSANVMDTLRYAIDTWQLGANSHKHIAREMTGTALADWETCTTLLPETHHRAAIQPSQPSPAPAPVIETSDLLNDRPTEPPASSIDRPSIEPEETVNSGGDRRQSLIHPHLYQGLEWLTTHPQALVSLGLGLARRIPNVVETNGFLSQAEQRTILDHLSSYRDQLAVDAVQLPELAELETFWAELPPGLIRQVDTVLQVHCSAQTNWVETLRQISADPAYAAFYEARTGNGWVSKGQYWEFPVEAADRLRHTFPDFAVWDGAIEATLLPSSQIDQRVASLVEVLTADGPPETVEILVDPIDRRELHQPNESADPNASNYSPSLQELRNWYASAKGLGQISSYLDYIHAIGRTFIEQNPQAEANPEQRTSGFNLSDRDRVYLLRDTTTYQQQVNEFRSMATTILTQQGQTTSNGNFSFQGRIYHITGNPDNFTVNIQQQVNGVSRGSIFTVENGQIARARINQEDMQKFKGFMTRIQQLAPTAPTHEYE